MHHACTDIYLLPGMLIPNPIGQAQHQARDANAGGFSVLLVAKHIQTMTGVSYDASWMFAGIMMILRLNQVF